MPRDEVDERSEHVWEIVLRPTPGGTGRYLSPEPLLSWDAAGKRLVALRALYENPRVTWLMRNVRTGTELSEAEWRGIFEWLR